MTYKVSFVIPTYNSGEFMAEGLRYLAAQHNESRTEFEVIVVDDGSADDTAELVEAARESLDHLIYLYIPRDEHSGRSRTRNRGIQAATGDILCFLDAGILVPPDYLDTVVARFRERPDLVLLHMVLGLNADPDRDDTTVVHKLSPLNLREEAAKLSVSPVWQDSRYQALRMLRDNLDLLAAPWEMGLGGAMSVSASRVREVGGYDDTFRGWGSEDIDFAYRLYRAGCSFRSERHAFVLHLPHPVARTEDRMENDFRNKRSIHRKLWQLETEAYPHYQGMFYSAFLEKLMYIDLSMLMNKFKAPFIQHLYNEHFRSASTSLLLGVSEQNIARQLNPTHIYLWNRRLESLFPSSLSQEIRCRLGCDTPYENSYFEAALITDFVLLFQPYMMGQIITELLRTARKIVYVYDPGFENEYPVQQAGQTSISMPVVSPHLTPRFRTELALSPRKLMMERTRVSARNELITMLNRGDRKIVLEPLRESGYPITTI
ncbi:glycosyltransferase family 2 protein [Paenibacillus sp. UNC499MF]|uniref:glycosyltransferase family 2 protein n=1 Tax=Paenibacillus sp. UNC499MF TaxID=1502751 RepID=UPI0008A00758|nr:glycosyltransferase family 2 protein [Paenibacillus sp. UNC499MF]SEG71446.1 Glycosyltransferase involved in cell wall bisynthesis [Paenibacillus sp. UNC499MF]